MDQKLPAPAGTDERRMRTLSSIFELTADLLRVEDISGLLQRIAESVKDQFGFDRVSLSILDLNKGIFTDHAMAGYPPEEETQVREAEGAFEVKGILEDFKPEFKLSRIAYYIPAEKQVAPETFVAVRDPRSAKEPRQSPDSWHELDLLYFGLYNRRGDMIGFLQVDYPRDGKIPSKETVSEIELFATIAAVGIENSTLYKQSQSLLKENETKTQRMMRLLQLTQDVLRIDDLDVVLQKVADAMIGTFEFRKGSVSLFTKNSNRVTVHALAGYTHDEADAVFKSEILKDKIIADLREEFRITQTGFFIPGEVQGNGTEFVYIQNPQKVLETRLSRDSWHELDLLYFTMHDREGDLIGIIQVDYPEDGKVPTKETIEAMEAFANIATIAIENSRMFMDVDRARGDVRIYLDLLTHDVGNLVNPVNAYLEMVMATTSLTPVQHKYITSALEASRSMTHLIRNVRRSSQLLESERVELVPSNLSRSLRQSAADAKSAFLGKKVEMKIDLPPQDLWVIADNFLDEVIYNVLTNAIKYDNHEEIVIDIEARLTEFESKEYALVRVVDRGTGIPDDMKSKIFSRDFRKLAKPDRPSTPRGKGAGMGLSIVKSLVDRYGGSIWVENRIADDYSRGSAFNILLPKA